MPNLLFVNGQIRALEERLLTVNRLDRMIGANTPRDAFRVMLELQYADQIDETTKPEDFESIIEQGLKETKDIIFKETEYDQDLQFLWIPADINNLKRAFKLKFLENKNCIEDFSQKNGFTVMGNLTKEDIEGIVFNNNFSDNFLDNFSEEFQETIEGIEALWEKNENMIDIEFLLDRAHFDYLAKISKKSNSLFLKNLFNLMVDSTNFKSLARSILIRKKPLDKKAFIPYGSFDWEDIKNTNNEEKLLKFSYFSSKFSSISEDASTDEKLMEIEKIINTANDFMLHEGQSGEIQSIQVPLSYFQRRLQDAKMLRFIMFAKFHKIAPDSIYKTLQNF